MVALPVCRSAPMRSVRPVRRPAAARQTCSPRLAGAASPCDRTSRRNVAVHSILAAVDRQLEVSDRRAAASSAPRSGRDGGDRAEHLLGERHEDARRHGHVAGRRVRRDADVVRETARGTEHAQVQAEAAGTPGPRLIPAVRSSGVASRRNWISASSTRSAAADVAAHRAAPRCRASYSTNSGSTCACSAASRASASRRSLRRRASSPCRKAAALRLCRRSKHGAWRRPSPRTRVARSRRGTGPAVPCRSRPRSGRSLDPTNLPCSAMTQRSGDGADGTAVA